MWNTDILKNRHFIIGFKVILTLLLLYYIWYHFDLSKSISILSGISLFTILLVIFLNVLAVIVGALKWFIFINQNISFWSVLKISFISRYYSLVLPGQLAGEAAKAVIVSKNNEHASFAIITLLLDKLSGILAACALGLIGVLMSTTIFAYHFIYPLAIATLSLLIIILFFTTTVKLGFRIISFIRLKWIQNSAINHLKSFEINLQAQNIAFRVKAIINIFLSLVYQLISVLIIYLFAKSLNIELSFFEFAWIFGIISIILILPVTIAGIGIREWSFIGIFIAIGQSREAALSLSLAFFSLQIFDALTGLAFHWFYKSR